MRSTSLASPTRAKCGTRTRITSSSPRSTNRFRCISRASPRRSSCRSTPSAWRCDLLRNGELMQLSRDQTLAQDLVDRGVFRRSDTLSSPFSNVLSSALGGPEAAPIVTHMQQEWGNVGLLCSDGLTKHVPDNRIRERLLAMTSAKQVCEDLLRDALDAGGTDNITVLVGRTLRKDPS